MSEELKPCPFCGGLSKSSRSDHGYGGTKYWYWIECFGCGTTSVTLTDKSEVITRWNTRHESGELPEWLKEKLNGYIQFCFENLERSAPFKNKLSDSNWKSSINAIRWVLSLKPPAEQEVSP